MRPSESDRTRAFDDALEQAWSHIDATLRPRGELWREQAWGKIAAQKGHVASALGDNTKPSFQKRRGRYWLSIGVAIMMAVLFVFRFRQATLVEPTHHYAAAVGQQLSVRLSDGSRMTLAPTTTATVSGKSITLQGEAFFDVAPHAAHPLTVRTTHAVVQVLGTRFDVRQYANDSRSQVVVVDGKVSVRTVATSGVVHRSAAVLSAGMLAQVTDSGVTVSPATRTDDYVSWTKGTLVFNDVALRSVLDDLTRVYGAAIRVDDSRLAEKSMFIELSVQSQSITEALDYIARAAGAHYTYDGHTFVFMPGRAATNTPAPNKHQSFPHTEKQYGR